VWGVLAVTSVSATANAPDCTTSPPSGACLKEAHENVTASSFGSTCDFEAQGTLTDGFHFIVPDSSGTGFSSLTVYFDVNGSLVTVTTTSGFVGPGGKGAIIDEPNGAILLEASATINGGTGSGAGSDGGDPSFNLSSTCAGTGGSTTTTSTPTTTTTTTTTTTRATTTTTPASTTTTASATGGSSGATTSAATSTQGAGLGAGSGTGAVQAAGTTSPNTGTGAAGPVGIGIGLAVAGLALLGLSYRHREKAE
jgi:hypothetical protein